MALDLPGDILTASRYEEIEQELQKLRDMQKKASNPKSFNDIFQ